MKQDYNFRWKEKLLLRGRVAVAWEIMMIGIIGASPVQWQHVSFTYTLTTGRSDRARPVSATTSDSCRSSIHNRISCDHFFCQLEVTYLEDGLQLGDFQNFAHLLCWIH